jgi:hypothetical protein
MAEISTKSVQSPNNQIVILARRFEAGLELRESCSYHWRIPRRLPALLTGFSSTIHSASMLTTAYAY